MSWLKRFAALLAVLLAYLAFGAVGGWLFYLLLKAIEPVTGGGAAMLLTIIAACVMVAAVAAIPTGRKQ